MKSQLSLTVFQILCSSVFQRRKAELFFENGSKFSLIGIAHLFRYFSDGIFCAGEKLSSFFHARFPKPGRDILAIDAAKVIFQAGFTDGEAFCNLANGNVLAQLVRKDLRRSFFSHRPGSSWESRRVFGPGVSVRRHALRRKVPDRARVDGVPGTGHPHR